MVSTIQMRDLEALKEIPGYTAILRAVLKSIIQGLVTQLSERAGEEAVVLTASVKDGTLGHLSSHHADDFLTGRDEIKAQFLSHCIRRHHTQKTKSKEPPNVRKRQRDDTNEEVNPVEQFSPTYTTVTEESSSYRSYVPTHHNSQGRRKSQNMASQSWSSSPVEYLACTQAETTFNMDNLYEKQGEHTPRLSMTGSIEDKTSSSSKRRRKSLQLSTQTGSVSSELGQMEESRASETQSESVFLIKQEAETVTQSASIFSPSGSTLNANQKTDKLSADLAINQSGSLVEVNQETDNQSTDSVLVFKQEPDGNDDDVTVVSMEPAVSQGMFEGLESGLSEMQTGNTAMPGTNGSPGEPVQLMSHTARLKTLGELTGTMAGIEDRNLLYHLPQALQTDLGSNHTELPPFHTFPGTKDDANTLSFTKTQTSSKTKGQVGKTGLSDPGTGSTSSKHYSVISEEDRTVNLSTKGSNSFKQGVISVSEQGCDSLGMPISSISAQDSIAHGLAVRNKFSDSIPGSALPDLGMPINATSWTKSNSTRTYLGDFNLLGLPISHISNTNSSVLGLPISDSSIKSISGLDSRLLGTSVNEITGENANVPALHVNSNKQSQNSNTRGISRFGLGAKRRFPCDQCSRAFSQRCDLRRHMAVHTGERFYCNACPKSFSQKHQRNLHQMTHNVEKSS